MRGKGPDEGLRSRPRCCLPTEAGCRRVSHIPASPLIFLDVWFSRSHPSSPPCPFTHFSREEKNITNLFTLSLFSKLQPPRLSPSTVLPPRKTIPAMGRPGRNQIPIKKQIHQPPKSRSGAKRRCSAKKAQEQAFRMLSKGIWHPGHGQKAEARQSQRG